MADDASRPPALEHRVYLSPPMVQRWCLEAHQRCARRFGERAKGQETQTKCRCRRFPERQNDAKRGDRGYDGAKKVKGRKRHIATDTDGNLLTCVVTPANIGERAGMKLVINILKKDVPELKKMFVDGGYDGEPFSLWAKTTHQLEIEVKRRPDEGVTVRDGIAQVPTNNPSEEQIRMAFEITRNGKKAFVVVSKRWVVERTFAWLYNFRRLKVDYEEKIDVSEGFIYAASSCILLRRLCA